MNIISRVVSMCRAMLLAVCVAFMASCSNNDYLNAIPSTATALVRISPTRLDSKAMESFTALLPVDDLAESGIDRESDVFAFETVDGNFGLCAKVKSKSKLSDMLKSLASKGRCGSIRKQGDFILTDISNSWAIGASDNALLVLGPVSAAALPDAQRRLTRMLRQDEDASILSRPIYAKVDSMKSAVAMVTQVQALPEKFIAPFTIGAPKDADASHVMLAVEFGKSDGIIKMSGETFSFNKQIDAALKKANGVYRTIDDNFLHIVPENSLFGLFTNVDGKQFLPLLQENKSMQALLAGMNTAIDFDNIIRSVNGNLVLVSSGLSADKLDMTMLAKVKNPAWTSDVDYWKQSCPAGSSITGNNGAWTYNSGDTQLKFGLADNTFYCTTYNALAYAVLEGKSIKDILPSQITDSIKGHRMVMLLNLRNIPTDGIMPQGFDSIIKSILGDADTLMYAI